jgi:hypothetical protein
VGDYHIWNPAYLGSGPGPVVLECHVTLGQAFLLGRGSMELVAGALAVLGVRETPRRWTFEAMRTHYFSSYRSTSTEWENRWDLAWRLRAELDQIAPLSAIPDWGHLDLDAIDDSFRTDDRPSQWPAWGCLVLADFADALALVEARSMVTRLCPTASLATGLAFGRIPQLRCDLGPRPRAFYEAGAAEAEQLLAALAAVGASVHFETSLA